MIIIFVHHSFLFHKIFTFIRKKMQTSLTYLDPNYLNLQYDTFIKNFGKNDTDKVNQSRDSIRQNDPKRKKKSVNSLAKGRETAPFRTQTAPISLSRFTLSAHRTAFS